MEIIDGRKIAQSIIERLKSQPKPQKTLAAILVGNDPASISFLKQKQRIADELGVKFEIRRLNEAITESDLIKEIKNIGESKDISGMIVQLPLPENLNRENILNAIPKEKDIDVLSDKAKKDSRGGKSLVLPPAVAVIEEIFKSYFLNLKSLKVAVVGLGFLVGKPISEWLKNKCAELYLLDIGDDLNTIKNADWVISGVGRAGLIKPEMLKNDAIIIDFGYDTKDGKISGDLDVSNLKSYDLNLKPGYYTPTPGGTGPILVAELFKNFYKLNS
ncbi:MAG: bifunctional 5,10-methylenetetrahydrofolate dehydrogenase/5,10-methenyltetrahydrofolate cyclohydrolase [Candidatus Wolfebacteria bacterium]|nr:bifunctional 5,10-methylenetetrahydrofolate dehydrogenase/5,10-methenyltetrahydrofolate cyclohydrolase [Candidatus Wolfebacteria bacterium]